MGRRPRRHQGLCSREPALTPFTLKCKNIRAASDPCRAAVLEAELAAARAEVAAMAAGRRAAEERTAQLAAELAQVGRRDLRSLGPHWERWVEVHSCSPRPCTPCLRPQPTHRLWRLAPP
jgi:hypothetical protein